MYAIIDASGDPSEKGAAITLSRFAQAGVIPTPVNAIISEIMRTWMRPEAAELAKLFATVSPKYGAVIESYLRAQEATRVAP